MAAFHLGIQLYTVRDVCAKDFKGTLKALAAMGYQGVEFAGDYGKLDPKELAAFLKESKLVAAGMHVSLADIQDSNSPSYQYAKAIKSPFLTTSLCGQVGPQWKQTIAEVAKAGAVAKAQGLVFTYHNHAQEFQLVDGKIAQDMMFEQTDRGAVSFELDTYWIKAGGQDPIAYINKFAGRVPQVHLKDMDPVDRTFTEVGAGLMDLPAIFAASKKAGAQWIIVEQDTCKRLSIDSARISATNLKKTGLI